jgi:hypothetical protein
MSTVFEDILAERLSGTVHCGTTAAVTLERVAQAFSLNSTASLYLEVDREAAHTLIRELLHRDLAYGTVLMPFERAVALADRFLAETTQGSSHYFTNVIAFATPTPSGPKVQVGPSWNPATEATFDMGVMVVTPHGSACFWVEDED